VPDIEMANYNLSKDDKQGPDVSWDRDDVPDDSYNNYIGAKLTLQKGDEVTAARVKKRKVDSYGNAVGNSNSNPILDTRMYTVEFADGAKAEYSANVIAENMWAQCDIDGNQY
jgi:hypothetical protein